MRADQVATEEKLLDQITKMDARIAVAKTQMGDRDKTKDVALGTSKINYIVSSTRLGIAVQLLVARLCEARTDLSGPTSDCRVGKEV